MNVPADFGTYSNSAHYIQRTKGGECVCVRGLGGEVGGIFKKTGQIFRIISGDIQGEDQERQCFFCEFSFKSLAITQKKKKEEKKR